MIYSSPDHDRLRPVSNTLLQKYHLENMNPSLGKRSWKMFYLTLRDLVLYCFKDEKTAQNQASFESPHAAVRIHHSVATAAQDYTKKQFVFRYISTIYS